MPKKCGVSSLSARQQGSLETALHEHVYMPVVGAAVLSKDNNPLYIRAFGSHNQLRFHFIVHTALDFVEEKGAHQRGLTKQGRHMCPQ